MIKLPWRRKVRIKMDDLRTELFIKDMLLCPKEWTSESMFQKLTINIDIKHPERLRRRVLSWLTDRCRYET